MGVDFENKIRAFRKAFPDEETCLRLLARYKWEDGFVCKKCGHSNYCRGKSMFSRRCTRCKSEESATAHTVFHRCKIPLNKAFEIAFLICSKPDISSYEISNRMEIRHMTCYGFQKKIANCGDSPTEEALLNKVLETLNHTVELQLN